MGAPKFAITVLGNSLLDYPRNQNALSALQQLGTVKIIPGSRMFRPYHPKFPLNIALLLNDLITTKIPRETTHVIVLFPDHEKIVLAALYRWLYRHSYSIVFDPLISLYDTYVFNKPSAIIRQPRPVVTWLFKWWLKLHDRTVFQLPDILLVDTETHGQYFQRLLNMKKNFSVLPISANEEVFKPTRLNDNIFWHASPLKVLWYGRLSLMHGMPYILSTIELLKDKSITFTIIGNLQSFPQDNIEYLKSINKLHYREVSPPHYLSLHEIKKFMDEHHVCLGAFGSTKKAKNVVSNKECEALASGRCLVTLKAPKKHLRHHYNCMMVDINDKQALAECLEQLHRNRQLLQQIATQGAADYQRFYSAQHVAKTLQRIISKETNPTTASQNRQ